jgi:hypothetical protein
MIRHAQDSIESSHARAPVDVSSVTERLRAVLAIYQRINELMGDWSTRSVAESDASMTAVVYFYHDVCRDLDAQMAAVERDVKESNLGIDLEALRNAREHIFIVLACDPVKLLQAERDIKEGRVVTLEQMRRELRNSAH